MKRWAMIKNLKNGVFKKKIVNRIKCTVYGEGLHKVAKCCLFHNIIRRMKRDELMLAGCKEFLGRTC